MSSKLDRSAIVAGAGLVASIFTTLVKKVREQGGTDEDIHRLATPDGEKILDEFIKLIVGGTRQTFKVLVDYTKTLAEMIKAGQYDWVNENITQDHFSVHGSGQKEVEIVLFHFNRDIASEQVIVEMEQAGFRPAKVEELLSLGASYPDLQKQFPVVALGSVWQGPRVLRYVPFLYRDGAERRFLDLSWSGHGWRGRSRFAAVRK